MASATKQCGQASEILRCAQDDKRKKVDIANGQISKVTVKATEGRCIGVGRDTSAPTAG